MQEEKIFIKPAKGLIIRDPDNISQIIPEEGKLVTASPQWIRYIKAGDVIEVTQEKRKGDK